MIERATMTPIARKVRAYFAPVARATSTPTSFDPAQLASFVPDAPPAPWVDLGWIENLKRLPQDSFQVRSGGLHAAPVAQVRTQMAARVEFDFMQWGKLQMALAAGAQHMNVLSPAAAVALQSGSTATQLLLGATALAQFSEGDLVVVDVDYAGATGYIGSGIAGGYVKSAADIGSNPDYVRLVSFNVARIASKTSSALVLDKPLLGGVPTQSAKIQKVAGFADRDGDSFLQEWSALFVLIGESGGRMAFYYPRLQTAAPGQESQVQLADELHTWSLHASFIAFPFRDPVDGQQVLCSRVYVPAASTPVY
jgi:hypothetical protein